MSEAVTKNDLATFKEELLENLNEQLIRAKEQLQAIRNEQEFNEDEKTAELIKANSKRRGISIKSYINREAVDDFSKKKLLNLCENEIQAQSKNFAEDEILIHEDGEMYIQKLKQNTPRDYSIRVGIGTVGKGAEF